MLIKPNEPLKPEISSLGFFEVKLNLDNGQMNLGFTNPKTAQLVHQQELPLVVSPLMMGLFIQLVQNRSKQIVVG